jgi:hypothetical protein
MTGKLTILNRSGDQTATWDTADQLTVAEVRARFDQLVKQEAWVGYAYPAGGGGPVVIREFDETAQEIVVRPQLVGG